VQLELVLVELAVTTVPLVSEVESMLNVSSSVCRCTSVAVLMMS
jgi:hypothetical protein